MAIDTSMYGQIKPLQIDGPLDMAAKAAQFKQMQSQNRLADLMFGEKQRAMEEGNALRGLLSDRSNYDERGNLSRGVLPKIGAVAPGQYGDYQKQIATQEKAALEAKKAQLEEGLKRFEVSGQIMAGVKDQATWTLARQQAAQLFGPEAAAQMTEQYDPALVEQKRMQAMSVKDQMEQQWKALNFQLDNDKFAYQQGNDSANRNVTVRGQNLTDARGREANDINRQLVGQERQLKVDKLQAEKDDREKSKKTAIAKAEESLAVIDKALKHPGREIATGKSGVLDPRNYMAGTDAMDFQVVLDQLGGQAFLQAFETLKGGGQITEVEGKKATDAMARLNRKQSDAEFKRSLQDLREVVGAGLQRAKAGAGGATPVPDAAPSSNIDALLKKYGG